MIYTLNSVIPTAFKLINVCVNSGDVNSKELENLKEHFPTRNIQKLTVQRHVEHIGVAKCVSKILGHGSWHLLYEKDGAPILYEYYKVSNQSISITHSQIEGDTMVAVSTSRKDGKKIGVDLTTKGDERLKKVAPRTMREAEVNSGLLAEVWAIKEAMFKAFGPGIDFKEELIVYVDELLEGKEYVRAEFRGKISKWWVSKEERFVVALGPC